MTQGCYDYLHVLLMVMCDIVRSDGMAKLSSYSVMIQHDTNIIPGKTGGADTVKNYATRMLYLSFMAKRITAVFVCS